MNGIPKWKRWRFFTSSVGDPRPVTFPPPGPWWCTGETGDGEYAIVVAYLPHDVALKTFWPEAEREEFTEENEIVFTSRFLRPEWWTA